MSVVCFVPRSTLICNFARPIQNIIPKTMYLLPTSEDLESIEWMLLAKVQYKVNTFQHQKHFYSYTPLTISI